MKHDKALELSNKRTVKVYPGEPLPKGIYLNGWKLDLTHQSDKKGPRCLYLIIEPEDARKERE